MRLSIQIGRREGSWEKTKERTTERKREGTRVLEEKMGMDENQRKV